MQSDPALPYLDLIDWWEAARWTAKDQCELVAQDLKSYALQATAGLATSQLMQTSSEDRVRIETEIANRVRACEEALASSIASLASDQDAVNRPQFVPTYQGWSYWDLGRILVGGSAPAAAAIVGARAAATAVAALGAAVVTAPITVTVGLAGIAWGAYSTAEAKRAEYKDVLCALIDEALLSLDGPDCSVLSRQYSRLDRIVQHQELSI